MSDVQNRIETEYRSPRPTPRGQPNTYRLHVMLRLLSEAWDYADNRIVIDGETPSELELVKHNLEQAFTTVEKVIQQQQPIETVTCPP